jgi:multiple sugar transport system ATP-binding protein
MNLHTARVDGGSVLLGGLGLPVPRDAATALGGLPEVTLGVRPESLAPTTDGGFAVTVDLVEELGADALVHGTADGDDSQRLVLRVDGRTPPALGDRITVGVRDADELHFFHPETGARLV